MVLARQAGAGGCAMSAPPSKRRKQELLTRGSDGRANDRFGDDVSVVVSKRLSRPDSPEFCCRPDADQMARERAALWGGKPPPVNEVAHAAIYDMNKELLENHRG